MESIIEMHSHDGKEGVYYTETGEWTGSPIECPEGRWLLGKV